MTDKQNFKPTVGAGLSKTIAQMRRSQELAAQAKFHPVTQEFHTLAKQLELSPFVEQIRRSQELVAQARLHPVMQEINTLAKQLEFSPFVEQIRRSQELVAQARLHPVMQEFNTLAKQLEFSPFVEQVRRSQLKVNKKMLGFGVDEKWAKLFQINDALNKTPAYSIESVNNIRKVLGDWTKPSNINDSTVLDESKRIKLYIEHGLDPSLEDLNENEATEFLSVVGVKTYYPLAPEIGENLSKNELGFQRSNRAHNMLQRLESAIRDFIIKEMTNFYGSDWLKHHVPGEMRKKWEERKNTALKAGETGEHLIFYADFTEYSQIFSIKNNWDNIFKHFFKRKEFIQESFQRLYPLRNSTMHCRPINEIDELYLAVEVHRIYDSIK